VAAGAKELEKETDVRPVALLLDSNSNEAADPSGHLYDVALRAFVAAEHVEAAAKALAALNKQEEAAAAALDAPLPQGDAKLAARITALAQLYGLRDETAARVRALLETNLRHASAEVATAAATALLAECEEAESAEAAARVVR
jgi:peptidyl-tRNA hydrolase